MCDLVCDRYPVLLIMSRFGIALGFGDKTIGEVCLDSGVDTATFLAVVNMHSDDKAPDPETISVAALVGYLRNSHVYFLDFRLPAIRRKLIEAIDCSHNDVAFAILRFFDEYVAEVHKHMDYEEQKVFRGLFDRHIPPAPRPGRGETRRTEADHHPLLPLGQHQRTERRAF